MKVHPKWHLLVSSVIAAISLLLQQRIPYQSLEILGQNLTIPFLCIAIGIGIDADHAVDYLIYGWQSFVGLEKQLRSGKILIFFHGIEIIPILLSLSITAPFLIFPAVSYACHLIMDIWSNARPAIFLQAYSYIIRFGRRVFA
jgi:hypothetical protein